MEMGDPGAVLSVGERSARGRSTRAAWLHWRRGWIDAETLTLLDEMPSHQSSLQDPLC